jgi:glucokinase
MKNIAIGVDIGGSHVTCQLFDLASHLLIEGTHCRKPVSSQGAANEILDAWAEAIRESARNYNLPDLTGIGFAMPGPFDYPGGIAWFRDVEKFDALYGINVRSEMQKRLGLPSGFPVRFLNDAACFAIGESFQGEAARHTRILAITLGTGFGTTFLDNHLPVAGKYGVPDDGFLYRVPFRNSVADDYFSTRWFLKEYETQTGKSAKGVKELAGRAATDAKITTLFNTFGNNLGTFLVPWLENFNAGCLVIGGNISASFPLFKDELLRIFRESGLSTRVVISSLGEDAALAGSASLCDNDLYSKLTTF